jgi:hypothetical protein
VNGIFYIIGFDFYLDIVCDECIISVVIRSVYIVFTAVFENAFLTETTRKLEYFSSRALHSTQNKPTISKTMIETMNENVIDLTTFAYIGEPRVENENAAKRVAKEPKCLYCGLLGHRYYSTTKCQRRKELSKK